MLDMLKVIILGIVEGITEWLPISSTGHLILVDEFIKLGQALKAAGVVESGVDAKFAVQDGLVKVNGQTELQRGKKLVSGDKVEYDGETIVIE